MGLFDIDDALILAKTGKKMGRLAGRSAQEIKNGICIYLIKNKINTKDEIFAGMVKL